MLSFGDGDADAPPVYYGTGEEGEKAPRKSHTGRTIHALRRLALL